MPPFVAWFEGLDPLLLRHLEVVAVVDFVVAAADFVVAVAAADFVVAAAAVVAAVAVLPPGVEVG